MVFKDIKYLWDFYGDLVYLGMVGLDSVLGMKRYFYWIWLFLNVLNCYGNFVDI